MSERAYLTRTVNFILQNWGKASQDEVNILLPYYLQRLKAVSKQESKLRSINVIYSFNLN